ncbi:hypothetical protein [Streptomyces sp. NPDC001315]|uniref:hypothetical protein n=1 Tax=Streptomyces sp. NPDC001315 TaxID=3364562 RepID=UPI0036C7F7B3
MSESTAGTTGLTSQYAAQVAGDLERNLKEQDRIGGEIAALAEQLSALQEDHAVLVNIQQALGVTPAPAEPAAEPATAVPAPRKKATAKAGAVNKARAKKSGAPSGKPTVKRSEAGTPAAQPARPTLVDIVREHLNGQSEPRSAAEIATALGQQHPERTIKATVVRTTLEGLVAKNQAHRAKQGASVFYTAPETPKPTAAADQSQEQPA